MMRRTVFRSLVEVVLSVALVLCAADAISVPAARLHSAFFAFGDLRAFYCSARVARAGSDPYRAEPIGACERNLIRMPNTNFVLPAPIPGQVIALFEPLAGLGFPIVAAFWCAVLTVTCIALSVMLTRLTSWPLVYSLAVSLPLALTLPILQGQIVPLAVALLVAATVALCSKRDGVAAIATALSTIEPHIGLPACIALFIERPRSRPFLIAVALIVGFITINTVGVAGTLEYVGRVLPEHIASEARYDDQYSLTYLLSWLRLPLNEAIVVGSLSYWLAAGTGIAVAIRLRRVYCDLRFVLFVPMAFSVLGGPYVHAEHLLAAVPLGVLLAATATRKKSVGYTLSLLLVAWPALYVLRLLNLPAVMLNLNLTRVLAAPGPLPLLAEAAWAARVEPNAGHWALLFAKLPSWIGLSILVAVVTIRAGRSIQLRSATRIASRLA